MAAEVDPKTKKPLFNLASGISLLLFYAFAMQCMSTLAVVKRETNSWKWPAGQLVFMSLFAYIVALIAYQLLNVIGMQYDKKLKNSNKSYSISAVNKNNSYLETILSQINLNG